jgi:hypothetical protein
MLVASRSLCLPENRSAEPPAQVSYNQVFAASTFSRLGHPGILQLFIPNTHKLPRLLQHQEDPEVRPSNPLNHSAFTAYFFNSSQKNTISRCVGSFVVAATYVRGNSFISGMQEQQI